MKMKVRLALREWEFTTPILLGEVTSDFIDLQINRVASLPCDLGSSDIYDAGECSFSQYVRAIWNKDFGVLGVPHFIMQGFSHRCIITNEDSELVCIEQLAGKRIGIVEDMESSAVWTRAVIVQHGVPLDSIDWYVGQLNPGKPRVDTLSVPKVQRLGARKISDQLLLDALRAGRLDAVITPVMPNEFFDHNFRLRHLLVDCRSEELRYFDKVGYVPGLSLLAVKAALLERSPWLGAEISRLLTEANKLWRARLSKQGRTPAWNPGGLENSTCDLSSNWCLPGLRHNAEMVAAFAAEMCRQGLVDKIYKPHELFPTGDLLQQIFKLRGMVS